MGRLGLSGDGRHGRSGAYCRERFLPPMAALGFTSPIFLESNSRSRAHVAGFGSTCFAVKMDSMNRRNRLPRLLPGPFHIGRNVSATCSVVIRFTGTSASAPACIRTSGSGAEPFAADHVAVAKLIHPKSLAVF